MFINDQTDGIVLSKEGCGLKRVWYASTESRTDGQLACLLASDWSVTRLLGLWLVRA